MTPPSIAGLTLVAVSDRPDLVAGPVATALAEWPGAADVWAMEIDPDLADTASFNAHFGWADEASGNCVVVSGKRAGDERIAALVVPADRRADVNTVVRKLLDVRKLSFHPHERAVAETGMEYGGIVPFGLPRTGASSSTRGCSTRTGCSSAAGSARRSCCCPAPGWPNSPARR